MAKPYLGVRIPFTMRIPADLHRICAARARSNHWSLNQYLIWAIADAVERQGHEVPEPVGIHQNVAIYDDNGERIGFI